MSETAEERARRRAATIVNHWMEPAYGDALEVIDDGRSLFCGNVRPGWTSGKRSKP